jgi:DNA damage-inducible protein 1
VVSINAPDEQRESDIVTLDLPSGMTVGETKELIKAETNFTDSAPQFFLNGNILTGDERTLDDAGIKDGEMLVMLIPRAGGAAPPRQAPAQQRRRPGEMNPEEVEAMRQNLLGNQGALARLREQQPELAAAVNDATRFRDAWQGAARRLMDQERERQQRIAMLNNDPFNIDNQREIERLIREDYVTESLQHAYEHYPEGMCNFSSFSLRLCVTDMSLHWRCF